MKKRLLLVWLCSAFTAMFAQKADLIVFSFDRPLQLYALLESAEQYVKNIGEIHVIYRSSNQRYDRAYQAVFGRFLDVLSIKQGNRPYDDFKPLLLNSFAATKEEYIVFAVDDIIIQDTIDCAECIASMKQIDAYGFYLRMGNNINYCYTLNKPQPVPSLHAVSKDVYSWTFTQREDDWGYPNTVDMTVYRKKEIEHDLRSTHYKAPNSFEAVWATLSRRVMGRKALCYAHSKMVNLPLNIVQQEWGNRHENSASVGQLLELFESGLKIDIVPLHNVCNVSPHMAYNPVFIKR